MAIDLDMIFIQRHGRFRISFWDLFPIGIVNICIACVLVAFILLSTDWSPSFKIVSYVFLLVALCFINMLFLRSLLQNMSFICFHNKKTESENKYLAKNILAQSGLAIFESESGALYANYSQRVGYRKKAKDVFVLAFHGSVMLNIRNHNEFDFLGGSDLSKDNIIHSFENIFLP